MSSHRGGGQPAARRQLRQLNPAFASAHGINDSKKGADNSRPGRRPAPPVDTNDKKKKADVAIRTARSSGKLNLSDCSLSRLPDEMFALRTSITIDLSLSADENPGRWQSFGEDEITLLDVSDNSLGGIDERVSNLTSLQILRARRCGVAEVPWRGVVLKLDNLLTLDLAGNSLSVAMLEFLPMTVREVDLSNNSLTRITDGQDDDEPLVVLPSLTRLDVANNRLKRLPMRMEVPSLQQLIFAGNEIGEIPDVLIQECRKSLTTLDGQRNQLQRVPSLIGCKRLRVVDFADNALIDVPLVGEDVVELNLINNKLTSICGLFAEIGPDFRSKLGELRLRGNKVESLDEATMRCLTSVTFIDASMNNLKDLPSVLGYLPCLRRMPLEGNAIRSIRASLLTNTTALKKFLRGRDSAPPGDDYLAGPDPAGCAGGALSKVETSQAKSLVNSALTGTFTLDLGGKQLSNMPGELMAELNANYANGDGTAGGRVRRLVLARNSVEKLDDFLSALTGLTFLDAVQNVLQSLPAILAETPVVALRLASNQLSSRAIASSPLCRVGDPLSTFATTLTTLDISGNRLEWLPGALSTLPSELPIAYSLGLSPRILLTYH